MKQAGILIIDDNQDLTDGLGAVLEGAGYQVTLAYNGQEGLAALAANDFDMVLVDIKLPDMSGLELFQRVHKESTELSILIMTGFRMQQLLSEAVGTGEAKIFDKPVAVDQVVEALKQIEAEGIVLVADDDPEFAGNLAKQLTTRGISALHARDCHEAVADLLANPVEVLVLDVQRPVICGLGTHLELRQQGCASKTVIIMGNKDNMSSQADVFRSAVTTGCLFKPFDPEEMLVTIERVLKKRA